MNINTAIVILNWNGKNYLEKFIQTLIDNTPSSMASIWVIDNASSDDSVKFLQDNYKTVNIIQLDSNYGFTGGYNKGLQKIDAKYYLLLNSDIEVPKHWLEPLVELMESDDNIGACSPKLLNYNNKNAFEYAGASGGFIDKLGYPFCRGRIFDTCEDDNSQYDNIIDCFWISGAAMMIKSELFHKLGGFNEDFFAHQEEIDLCWRLKNNGYRIVCEPKSYVYHVGGGTLPKSNPYKTYLNFRNNLFLIKNNTTKSEATKILFLRFFLDYLAALRMILQGNTKEFISVIKAWWHFINKPTKHKPKNVKKINEHQQIYKRSIVFDYFFYKKQHFNDLDFR